MTKRLTLKQLRFVNEYVSNDGQITATEAAKRAGYGENRATVTASELLNPQKHPEVVRYIDKMKQEVVLDGAPVHLSTTEFEALVLIAEHAGETLDREFLVENLRGIQWQSFDRSIDVLVSRLRNKLGETPERTRFIKTVHGVGYIFIASKVTK